MEAAGAEVKDADEEGAGAEGVAEDSAEEEDEVEECDASARSLVCVADILWLVSVAAPLLEAGVSYALGFGIGSSGWRCINLRSAASAAASRGVDGRSSLFEVDALFDAFGSDEVEGALCCVGSTVDVGVGRFAGAVGGVVDAGIV